VNLLTLVDVKKVVLQTFVAVSLNRVPPVLSYVSWAQQSHGSSSNALEVAVSDLHTQMNAVLNKLDDIKSGNLATVLSHNMPSAPIAGNRTKDVVPIAPSMPGPVVQRYTRGSFVVYRCSKTGGKL
jgi:hypothetical protein